MRQERQDAKSAKEKLFLGALGAIPRAVVAALFDEVAQYVEAKVSKHSCRGQRADGEENAGQQKRGQPVLVSDSPEKLLFMLVHAVADFAEYLGADVGMAVQRLKHDADVGQVLRQVMFISVDPIDAILDGFQGPAALAVGLADAIEHARDLRLLHSLPLDLVDDFVLPLGLPLQGDPDVSHDLADGQHAGLKLLDGRIAPRPGPKERAARLQCPRDHRHVRRPLRRFG